MNHMSPNLKSCRGGCLGFRVWDLGSKLLKGDLSKGSYRGLLQGL